MSAFVVEPNTINRILGYLRRSEQTQTRVGTHVRRLLQEIEFDFQNQEYAADLGQAMYNMNINAVSQCYPDDDMNSLPGTYHEEGVLDPYEFKAISCGQVQALKSLRCWLYQCSEGNVPDGKLHATFEKMENLLTSEIISSMPEYEKACWG